MTSLLRIAFVLYALTLATLTHWPRLTVHGPVARPDLYLHLGAFGLWTLLLGLTRWTGPIGSRAGTLRAAGVAAAVALTDEATQALPGLHRVVAWEDALANLAGVTAGALTLLVLPRIPLRGVRIDQ